MLNPRATLKACTLSLTMAIAFSIQPAASEPARSLDEVAAAASNQAVMQQDVPPTSSTLRMLQGAPSLLASTLIPGRSVEMEFARLLTGLPAYTHPKRSVRTTAVVMKDGAELNTRIYEPEGEGPWPTLLVRDPYLLFQDTICEFFVRYGFACVHQDVRGRFGSSGEFYPMINERKDGIETLNWLVAQGDIHNGNIALIGPSYGGMVQLIVADQLPPEVKTLVADTTTGSWYGVWHRRGHVNLLTNTSWAAAVESLEDNLTLDPLDAFDVLISTKPPIEAGAAVFDSPRQWYRDLLSHNEPDDAYWDNDALQALKNSHRSINVPVLMTTGWHDIFFDGQIKMFEELPTRNESLFIIRQGDHEYGMGDLDINKTQLELTGDIYRQQLTWLNQHLRGDTSNTLPTGYLTHLNHENRWHHSEQFPASIQQTTLHLSELDQSPQGGGKLANKPSDESHVSYRYDPENPVPTLGGRAVLPITDIAAGSVEQGKVHEREDVLSFLSEPFPEGATLAGSIQATLTVKSDAADSAFTVKLVEVFADGRTRNIRDDITSLRYRDDTNQPQPYQAGSKVDVTFNIPPIEWQLAPSSQLRLDISSSNYPAYNAHPNRVGNWATMTESTVATQSVYKGVVVLPLNPLSTN